MISRVWLLFTMKASKFWPTGSSWTQLDTLLAKMVSRTNSQFLTASVTEFISVWAIGGDASLNLTTKGAFTTIIFNCTIGVPGAHHSKPPTPPSAPSSSASPASPPRPCWVGEEQATSCPSPGNKGCKSPRHVLHHISCWFSVWYSNSNTSHHCSNDYPSCDTTSHLR